MSGAREKLLVCPPDFYDVDYVINPWMEGNVHRASQEGADRQWKDLIARLSETAELEQVPPKAGLPDMVFTANAGLVVGNRVVLSRFLPKERQGEEAIFRDWFKARGFEVYELPPEIPFEGAGDALMDRQHPWLWAGYGFRSDLEAHPYLAKWLELEVISIRLADPRFYHLDTCLCPLEGGYLLYYPAAFDAYSNRIIEQRVPEQKRITVSEADAVRFACNAVNLGQTVFLNQASEELKSKLERHKFKVIETPLTEFIKSGGSAKCLTLRLTEPQPEIQRAETSVKSRRIRLEGHLLDNGLLERALDLTVQSGGSFHILHFALGKQRQSSSRAEIQLTAPSEEVLDKIMSQLVDLGAVAAPREQTDAELKPVSKAGVAPDEFYATTIYPTEARVQGKWLPVLDQRMDGVISISQEGKQLVARCKLFRYLQPGEQVVVGSQGIRTTRKTETRDSRAGEKEFAFMGGAVSSERRVELAVDYIAWEMRRIREQEGRILVVAGPVVIHTGGSEHLAWLIRQGFIQALLGGNAIAVHDIEQALLGTSLGLDLKRGVPVRGGHRHHLRAINTICGCGGIRQAVEQGVLTSGIFYECIRKNIPFSLAGSIRDDGPLPETHMDLIRAQEDYARLIKDADMIIMLSSMLHSIGVGNMTPAGVKLVCVDINPAVVTKLSDRGSVESTGIVTDVGLFLNLLIQRLTKLDQMPKAA
jgi:lysine-ketoglutarate reductase/saccharopine dehydrogenase-like protein (TIGR00300 family)